MPSEIVIARYAEDLDWVGGIPDGFEVIIYNKGPQITSAPALRRADAVRPLANSGRESDTFLRHILGKTAFRDGFTVFLQGDPFEHSPDLLPLLKKSEHWQDVQPLSWRWRPEKKLPPPAILARETTSFIEGARIRPELFSIADWGQLKFFDQGARTTSSWYRHLHGLPEDVGIAADFLQRCEWTDLATQAEGHLVGLYSYGALFAARQERLARMPRRGLERALDAANGHEVYGYVLERLWLHLSGVPFLFPTGPAMPRRENVTYDVARIVPPAPKKPLYRRAIPGIKRRVADWARE